MTARGGAGSIIDFSDTSLDFLCICIYIPESLVGINEEDYLIGCVPFPQSRVVTSNVLLYEEDIRSMSLVIDYLLVPYLPYL